MEDKQFPNDDGWFERFEEGAGNRLRELFNVAESDLPEALAEKLRGLEQSEPVKSRSEAVKSPRAET
jgi:hypothetical protein